MVRSIGAVATGVVTIVLLSVVTDYILESIGFFPPATEGLFDTRLLLFALAYRTVYAAIGGYITARLAPTPKIKHLKILLGIGIVMGLLGVVAGWNLSGRWYPISLVVTSALAVWYGGKYGLRK